MANRASSPFPTSHDTLGFSAYNASTLGASSPWKAPYSHRKNYTQRKGFENSRLKSPAPVRQGQISKKQPPAHGSDGSDSDANLSDYTFDLDKLPGELVGVGKEGITRGGNKDQVKEGESLSDPGGPDDFTLNMIELMKGSDSDSPQLPRDPRPENVEDEDYTEEDDDLKGLHDDEDDESDGDNDPRGVTRLDECSELEPPLETSTPAHLLWRKDRMKNETSLNGGTMKTSTIKRIAAPQLKAQQKGDTKSDLKEMQGNSEKKNSNHRTTSSDTTSTSQYAEKLQSQLDRQTSLMQEFEATLMESTSKDNEIRRLRHQLDDRDRQLESNKSSLQKVHALEQELNQLRTQTSQNENAEHLSHSHEEVLSLQAEVEEKENIIQKTESRLQEAMAARQLHVEEKTAEIEGLKLREAEQTLKITQLENELGSVSRERDILTKRTSDLDRIMEHLESRVTSLESEISTAKSEDGSKVEALRSLLDKLSLPSDGMSFSDMIQSLQSSKKLGQANKQEQEEQTGGELRVQLQESASLKRILTLQLETTREELSEAQNNLAEMKAEKSQLLARIEELEYDQEELQKKFDTVTQERDQTLHLAGNHRQQPSPPTSPPLMPYENTCQHNHEAVENAHQAEIEKLRLAHNTEVSNIRDSQSQTIAHLNSLLSTTQDRENQLKAELASLRNTQTGHETEMGRLTNEQARLKSVIEAKDSAAAELDERFSHVLQKREQTWEARVDKLLHERERMSKALLWTWGEMEVGDASQPGEDVSTRSKGNGKKRGEGQGYKYKYVDRTRERR